MRTAPGPRLAELRRIVGPDLPLARGLPGACAWRPRLRPGRRCAGRPGDGLRLGAAGRCARWDIPDTPARAWRGRDGRVRLVAGSEESRASHGPGPRAACARLRGRYTAARARTTRRPTTTGRGSTRPIADGARVTALAHVEYHGHLRPTAARRRLRRVLAQRDRRAALRRRRPELRARGRAGGRAALSLFRRCRRPQRLLQSEQHPAPRRRISTPSSWRSLRRAAPRAVPAAPAGRRRARRTGAPGTGTGFNVRFADPYREDVADPARHVCAPVEAWRARSRALSRRDRSGRLPRGDRRRPARAGRHRAERHLLDDLGRPLALERAGAALGGAAALAARLRRAAAYAYPSLLDAGQPVARTSRPSTRASGSTSSRCRSAPAAGSAPSAT